MRNTLILVVATLFLTGCSTTRREAKKDAQALVRISLNPKLSNEANKIWLSNNPIVNTPPVVIHGKDSIVYINDTIVIDNSKDSIIKIACPTLNLDSLKKALTKTNTILHYKTDTLQVIDTACARLYNQKVAENNYLTGQGNVKDRQLDDNASEIRSLKLWRIVGGIAALLIIVFLVYIIIRKK